MSTPVDTDRLLVTRGGTSYYELKENMAEIEDTDLLLVSRAGTSYKITGADYKASFEKAPGITSATLTEDDTSGDRFTNEDFTVTLVMSPEGVPISDKLIKPKVTGEFTKVGETTDINSIVESANYNYPIEADQNIWPSDQSPGPFRVFEHIDSSNVKWWYYASMNGRNAEIYRKLQSSPTDPWTHRGTCDVGSLNGENVRDYGYYGPYSFSNHSMITSFYGEEHGYWTRYFKSTDDGATWTIIYSQSGGGGDRDWTKSVYIRRRDWASGRAWLSAMSQTGGSTVGQATFDGVPGSFLSITPSTQKGKPMVYASENCEYCISKQQYAYVEIDKLFYWYSWSGGTNKNTVNTAFHVGYYRINNNGVVLYSDNSTSSYTPVWYYHACSSSGSTGACTFSTSDLLAATNGEVGTAQNWQTGFSVTIQTYGDKFYLMHKLGVWIIDENNNYEWVSTSSIVSDARKMQGNAFINPAAYIPFSNSTSYLPANLFKPTTMTTADSTDYNYFDPGDDVYMEDSPLVTGNITEIDSANNEMKLSGIEGTWITGKKIVNDQARGRRIQPVTGTVTDCTIVNANTEVTFFTDTNLSKFGIGDTAYLYEHDDESLFKGEILVIDIPNKKMTIVGTNYGNQTSVWSTLGTWGGTSNGGTEYKGRLFNTQTANGPQGIAETNPSQWTYTFNTPFACTSARLYVDTNTDATATRQVKYTTDQGTFTISDTFGWVDISSNITSSLISVEAGNYGGTATNQFAYGLYAIEIDGVVLMDSGTFTTDRKDDPEVELYCVLDSAGDVSDLTATDPGYTQMTSTSPQPKISFPATFPTGETPDVDLPEGTALQVDVKVSNTVSYALSESNSVTPT